MTRRQQPSSPRRPSQRQALDPVAGPGGINRESDVVADLSIAPTSTGMVRIYVAGDGVDLPMDFEPDDAEAIAEELAAAAAMARGNR